MFKELLREFAVVFPDVPGRTTVAVHDVYVEDSPPIRQHPCGVNPVKLKLISQEVDYTYVADWDNQT